jgi:hypothetical protein
MGVSGQRHAPAALYRFRYPLDKRLGGPQSRSGCGVPSQCIGGVRRVRLIPLGHRINRFLVFVSRFAYSAFTHAVSTVALDALQKWLRVVFATRRRTLVGCILQRLCSFEWDRTKVIKDEQVRILKDAIVSYFRLLFWYLVERLRKSAKTLFPDSQ